MESNNQGNFKKQLGITIIGFVALVILVLFGIYNNNQNKAQMLSRINALEQSMNDVKQIKVSLSPELEQKVETAVSTSIKKVESTNEQVLSQFKQNYESKINAVVSEISEMAKSKIKGNEVAAERAFLTALRLVAEKKDQLAKIYCLNAINHMPYKKQYFEEYFKIYKASIATASLEDIEQIKSVFESGIFQVEEADIAPMQSMLQEILKDYAALAEKTAVAQNKAETEKQLKTLNSLRIGDLSLENVLKDGAIKDIVMLQRRIEAMGALLEAVDAESENGKWLKMNLKQSSTILEYGMAGSNIEKYLDIADAALDKNPPTTELAAISSQVQTANNILSQLWSLDMSALPEKMRENAKHAANRIALIEVKFNKIKSGTALNKIYSFIKEADDVYQKPILYTTKIVKLQQCAKDIMLELSGVYDMEKRKEIELNIEQVSKNIANLNKERYKAYQKWAVEQCDNAFTKYKAETVVSTKEAENFIDGFLLEIDTALLTPEVSTLYQDILRKLLAKVDAAKYEIKLATRSKKTLEDF